MSTITIDNPKITKHYSEQELRMKFLQFLEQELWEKHINLYEIEVDTLSSSSQKRFSIKDQLNYLDY